MPPRGSVELGRFGVWSWAPAGAPAAVMREVVPEIEELGYGALWWPEAIGKECFSTAAMLLQWSERLVVASGIASIYARDPTAAANGARALGEAYPGRFVLGLGVSHSHAVVARGHEYLRPLPAMQAYLDGMDAAVYRGPEPEEPVPVVLAALGPKMLELARERAAGAHPYFVPVEHTAIARERLGPDSLLAVEQAVILERDDSRARELAREHAGFYLQAENYRNSMLRLGFDEADLADSGSNRLLEAVVAWGDEDTIRARVQAHLDAGADHVCIQPLHPQGQLDVEHLRRLAPALVSL